MRLRKLLIGVGTAITTFLLVDAAALELLPSFVGEGFDVVTAALALGALAALLAGALVTFQSGLLNLVAKATLAAYAVFGVAFVVLWWLTTNDVAGAASMLTLPVQIGVSLAAAVVTAFIALRRNRGRAVASA
jgi:hypothetical protein